VLVGVNTAVMECVAVDNVVVAADVALPLVTVTGLPRVAVPSMNCTEPAAVFGVTVAVNVTEVPDVVGLVGLAVSVVVVAVGPPPVDASTSKLSGSEVELANVLGLLEVKTAVIECVSTDRFDVVKVADPAVTVAALPSAAVPSMNCTVPGAVEGEIVAVNVTDVPDVTGPPGFDAMAVVVAAAPDAFTT
jgi:hypothetical protein